MQESRAESFNFEDARTSLLLHGSPDNAPERGLMRRTCRT